MRRSPWLIDAIVTVARIRPVGERRRAGRDEPVDRAPMSAVSRSFNQLRESDPWTKILCHSDRFA